MEFRVIKSQHTKLFKLHSESLFITSDVFLNGYPCISSNKYFIIQLMH